MTTSDAVRDWIAAYTGLVANAPVWVQHLGAHPVQYAVITLPGNKVLEKYLNGGSLREYPFILQAAISTADDKTRITTDEFFEAISDWFDTQTQAGNLPSLGTKKTAWSIEALASAVITDESESGTGIYELPCRLVYEQAP